MDAARREAALERFIARQAGTESARAEPKLLAAGLEAWGRRLEEARGVMIERLKARRG
jgi:hypothetical protein